MPIVVIDILRADRNLFAAIAELGARESGKAGKFAWRTKRRDIGKTVELTNHSRPRRHNHVHLTHIFLPLNYDGNRPGIESKGDVTARNFIIAKGLRGDGGRKSAKKSEPWLRSDRFAVTAMPKSSPSRIAAACLVLGSAGLHAVEAAEAATDAGAGWQSDGRALPHSNGRRFDTLDQYLRHLERQGGADIPYYRQVRPGLYELVSNLRALDGRQGRGRLYTRRELMRMFGFTR